MATVTQVFSAGDFSPDLSNTAGFVVSNGTNYPVPSWSFDAGTDEAMYIVFRATNYGGSGNLTIKVIWYADTATSGNVIWAAQIAAITPNTDSQDVTPDALGTENTVTDSHLGTTAKRLHEASITLSNLDSLAADDYVTLKIRRDADNASDTMAGDALMTQIIIEYSDT